MKLLKPTWVSHAQFAIYSVDIHPDGTRFASGGGDNKIRIWSMGPLNSSLDEQNIEFPKQLACLQNHISTVNSVRWSHDGKYLASCGDDSVVMLWQCAIGSFGGGNLGEDPNHENWRAVAQGKGHESSVNDVAWSADNTKVASCSADNTVIIWDVPKLAKIAVLKEHTNFVVGMAWDPLGRYLATQSSDKSMIIWGCTDWKMESKVEDPFKTTTATTFFSRPSWSPDGSLVCASHGRNGVHHIAAVVSRDKRNVTAEFVGHTLPVVVSRFNPCIIHESGGDASFKCMIGSQDGCFSVWSTTSPRPMVAVRNVFEQTIHDAAWTKNGRGLLVCSADGTVAYCIFEENELGVPLSAVEHKAHLKKLYGDAMIAASGSIIEDPLFISPLKPVAPSRTSAQPLKALAPADVKTNQVEQRTTSGKRRITPVLVQTEEATQAKAPAPFVVTAFSSAKPPTPINSTVPVTLPTTTTSTKQVISPEKPAPTTVKAASVAASASSTTPSNNAPSNEQQQPPSSQQTAPSTQQPKSATSTTASATTTTTTTTTSSSGATKRKEPDQPDAVVKKTKKKLVDGDLELRRKLKKHKSSTSSGSTAEKTVVEVEKIVAPPMLVPASLPSTGRLARMLGPQGRDGSVEIRVEGDKYTVITCAASKTSTSRGWDARILGRAVLLAANSNFTGVACDDGTIHVFSPAGRLLFPPLALTAPLAFLESNQTDHLMAVTTDGLLTVWNIPRTCKEVSAQQLPLSLISQHTPADGGEKHITISHAWIGDNGQPVVMSSRMAFAYHIQMGTWMCVANGTDPMSNIGSNSNSGSAGSITPSLLGKVSNTLSQSRPSVLSLVSGPEGESISALEAGLASAQILGSVGEYKHWLHAYTRRLVENADVSRLQELCNNLLGPPGSHITRTSSNLDSNTASSSNNTAFSNQFGGGMMWEPTIIGIPKRELLREILPIMSANRSLQRLVTQFREMLAVMTGSNAHL